jgi:hypothetical protein
VSSEESRQLKSICRRIEREQDPEKLAALAEELANLLAAMRARTRAEKSPSKEEYKQDR